MNFLTQKQSAKVQQPVPRLEANQLTQSEIEVVLRLLASTSFPVKDIEILYSAIIKLQEQFKSQINDKNESQ